MFEPGRLYVRDWAIDVGSFIIPPNTPLFCINCNHSSLVFRLTFLHNEQVYFSQEPAFSLVHWRDAETGKAVENHEERV